MVYTEESMWDGITACVVLTVVGPLEAACSMQGPAEPSDLEWFLLGTTGNQGAILQLAAAIPSKVCCCTLLQFIVVAAQCC